MNAMAGFSVETDHFRDDVRRGLGKPQKKLPSKYFYDVEGSKLFDQICELDEYYPTRTELDIIRMHAPEMAECCGSKCLLVELGAGSLKKVRPLIDHLDRLAGFVPVDVSSEHLEAASLQLRDEYPDLDVFPVTADFTSNLNIPTLACNRKVVFFPGSTLGNFEPPEADELLHRIARFVGPGGGLLLGIDLRKDPRLLEAAYNDRLGVTAAFNRNLLVRINRELGADFDPMAFRHRAYYNRLRSRIEMHLVSERSQRIRIDDAEFHFQRGESIHTENSHKYDLAEFTQRAGTCGFRADVTWTDAQNYFAVMYLTATIN